MSSSFGEYMQVTIFGQSHGKAIGVVIDGLPAGEPVDMEALSAFMGRRRPGQALATRRKEMDIPEILSGLVDGVTCGAPLCAVISNSDTRSQDYSQLKDVPRPSHADYPAAIKHKGANDVRGGGHFSGRLTAPLCVAGGIAKQMLSRRGIVVGAHLLSVGGVKESSFHPVTVDKETLARLEKQSFPVLDQEKGEAMGREIAAAAAEGDSVGGVVECCVLDLPVGLGEPMFGGVENRLSQGLFGIPALRGVEFGAGFAAAEMRGSQHNDPYTIGENGRIVTVTNRHGGVLGGMTTGMPLILRAAFKPTPSIAKLQTSVSLSQKEEIQLRVHGRHDPCVALRAVPCVEAVTAVVLLDMLLASGMLPSVG